MLRWIGAAVVGAVRVAGGATKVREPRLPKFMPPPTRASAGLASMPNASAMAAIAASLRNPKRFIGDLPASALCDSPTGAVIRRLILDRAGCF